MTQHLGIDLGATNLKWSVLESDAENWRSLGSGSAPTESSQGPDAVIGRLVDVGRAALERWPDISSVGIGVPGVYDPATGRTVFLVNLPGHFVDQPVGPRVAAALLLPVALINDARAFGLAELRLGAGRGASSLVGLTLGTGVGGVIAIDGRVHLGHDGSAGEIGHMVIDPDGPSCNCGNDGCLEAFARADRIAEACGTESVEAAGLAAARGDEQAIAGLARTGRYLGIGIANLVTLISPDVVVIGGGVAACGDHLLGPTRDEVARRVRMTSLAAVEIRTAELGTWAGSIGAAIHGAEAAVGLTAAAGAGGVR